MWNWIKRLFSSTPTEQEHVAFEIEDTGGTYSAIRITEGKFTGVVFYVGDVTFVPAESKREPDTLRFVYEISVGEEFVHIDDITTREFIVVAGGIIRVLSQRYNELAEEQE